MIRTMRVSAYCTLAILLLVVVDIVLLVAMSSKATKLLRKNGIKVGILGAKMSQFD